MNHVFIIGATRSGTKFLRDALGSSAGTATVPHDINYVWRRGNESLPHDEIAPSQVSAKDRTFIREQIRKLAGADESTSVLLEKTVSNCVRVDLVRDLYPNAKLVHLHRDPFDTIESIHRQWLSPLEKGRLSDKIRSFPLQNWRYAIWFVSERVRAAAKKSSPIWGVRYPGIETDLSSEGIAVVASKQWIACERGWKNRTLKSDLDYEISYADVFQPQKLRELCEFLKIAEPQVVENYVAERGRPVIGSWPRELSDVDQAAIRNVLERASDIHG